MDSNFAEVLQQFAERAEAREVVLMDALHQAMSANVSNHNERRGVGDTPTIHRQAGKVPVFQGSREAVVVHGFLASMELHLHMHGIQAEETKVAYFGSYLADAAQVWFHALVQNRYASIPYEELVQQFKARFLPIRHAENAYEKLIKLTQVRSAAEYIDKFSELSMMVEEPYDNPKLLLRQFIKGLKPDVRAMIQAIKPADLNTAFEQAQEMDEIYGGKENRTGSSWKQRFMNPSPNRGRHPDAMDIDAITFRQHQDRGYSRNGSPRNPKSEVTCYNCLKKGHYQRECPEGRRSQQYCPLKD